MRGLVGGLDRGDLAVEHLPPREPLLSDPGVRFRWSARPRRGTWVRLLLPDDLDAERSVDPRVAYVEDGVRELRVEPGGRAVRVLARRREDYRLELEEAPPLGTRLVLPVGLAVLERQVAAVHRLRDAPQPWQLGLLRLGRDPARAGWRWVAPEEPDRWFLLTDPSIDGTEEQRDWVRRALGTPDLVVLDGPPGSGKTHAIAELIVQLVLRGKRVLLCSSAHVAVDNVLERLAGRFAEVEALRIGHTERVSPPVRACALDARLEALLAAWDEAPDGHGVPVPERRHAALRLLLASANLVCGTTAGLCGEPALGAHAASRPFDVLVIDEASRATFPEFLVPALLAERHVIVGDPRQLPPFLERADLEAALAGIADPGGKRLTPDTQRACLLAARLERSDARELPWLVVETAAVADALEAEVRVRGGLDLVRVVRRGAGPGRVGLDALRAGTGDLALAAAGAVLVEADLVDLAMPWLPAHLVPLGTAPGSLWARRTAALTGRSGEDPRALAEGVRADLAGRTWAGELAWRIDRVHQLEHARSAQDRGRREREIGALLPRAQASWIGEALAELRDVGVRSVIECIGEGRASGPTGRRSPLAQGLPRDVRAERWVRLSYQHRMDPALSALPRALSYDHEALRDARSLEGRAKRLGWDPPLVTQNGHRRFWIDVQAADPRDQARAEAQALGALLPPLLAWMAVHPCRAGRPWEVACLSPYGYLMELRQPRFRALEDFMARRVTPGFGALAAAAFQFADAFFGLHVKGLCYRDISFANVFFDPANGDVRVCDNDNVDVSGAATGGVLGTPRFMAPEVVRGEAAPSDRTDRFSLAVLLFHLLMGGHPLDGQREAAVRCLDLPALRRLYGVEPVYVFDPRDASNRPVPGLHDNPVLFHPLWPAEVHALFERSFTVGLHEPDRRVLEGEWRRAFLRCLDQRLRCACGAELFLDPATARPPACWRCRKPVAVPLRLAFADQALVLQPGQALRPHHLGGPVVLDERVGEVVAHPSDPGRWGLRNRSVEAWTLRRPDGSLAPVAPGQTAPLIEGNRIAFGTVVGEVG